jgi:deoxyribodipyrimidine photo-lyase
MPFQRKKRGIFLFHRDLRLVDNVGLTQACIECDRVFTCFIFTPEQVGAKNDYRSDSAVHFMIESLEELDADLRRAGGELITLYGSSLACLRDLVDVLDADAIFYNKDYTPYALARDAEIVKYGRSKSIDVTECADYYLYEPGTVVSASSRLPYKKFTPFYDAVVGVRVPASYPVYKRYTAKLSAFSGKIYHAIRLADAASKFVRKSYVSRIGRAPDKWILQGGRQAGLARLRRALKDQSHYVEQRDQLTYETTGLSSYLKFGCVSVREVYHAMTKQYGARSGFIRELIWREFYAHLLFGFPQALTSGRGYNDRMKHIPWRHSTRDFEKWKAGQTGFPVVDACMRQLNATGYMHNRGRMIVANFLVKTLLVDWTWGERYFAQQLRDYDPASNNGNWQSISGTGADAKPYFRDMNPWIQSAKFDREAVFIKEWVPELRDVDAREIHKWDLFCHDEKHRQVAYPPPMVAYGEQKERMLKMYRDHV